MCDFVGIRQGQTGNRAARYALFQLVLFIMPIWVLLVCKNKGAGTITTISSVTGAMIGMISRPILDSRVENDDLDTFGRV